MYRDFLLVGQKNYEHFTLIILGIGEKNIRVFVIIVILLAYNAISKEHADYQVAMIKLPFNAY